MEHAIACIHTSPAALGPVAQYYGANAPELEITNLLDDGLLRWFAADRSDAVEARLAEMLRVAREWYGAEAALLTCSSISRPVLESLRANAGIPVMKIDQPMARTAVAAGQRVGVAVTFGSTLEPTSRLLRDAAAEAGKEIDLVPRVVDGAYDALLGGDPARHDTLLVAGVEELAAAGVDVVSARAWSSPTTAWRAIGRTGGESPDALRATNRPLDLRQPAAIICGMDLDALVQAWRRRGERDRARRRGRAEQAREDARRAAAVLKSEFGVAEVWLFGSVATEPRHDAFDIDLAVRGLPADRYFAALARVHDLARERVELIPLEACSESVHRAVVLTGRRIDDG